MLTKNQVSVCGEGAAQEALSAGHGHQLWCPMFLRPAFLVKGPRLLLLSPSSKGIKLKSLFIVLLQDHSWSSAPHPGLALADALLPNGGLANYIALLASCPRQVHSDRVICFYYPWLRGSADLSPLTLSGCWKHLTQVQGPYSQHDGFSPGTQQFRGQEVLF